MMQAGYLAVHSKRSPVPGCCCAVCVQGRADKAAYARRRRRLVGYGRWPDVFTDPAATRVHLKRIQDETGLGLESIAELAGISRTGLRRIAVGQATRIRVDTERAVLAVWPNLDQFPARTVIDATGTRRRVHALQAAGWSMVKIAPLIGVSKEAAQRLLSAERVTAETARRVRTVFDQRWQGPGPAHTPGDRMSKAKARGNARRHGWPPPLAWEGVDIDNPAARPDLGRKNSPQTALVEEYRWLKRLDPDITLNRAAKRLGLSERHLVRILTEHQRKGEGTT